MSTVDPFGFGVGNPWLLNDGVASDDAGDLVVLGNESSLTNLQDTNSPPDHIKATVVSNNAPGNMAFTGRNESHETGVFGLFGESDGAKASAGVLGSSACWGVAGVSSSDTINSEADFPTATGVFGVGDICGVYGQSTPSSGQQPSGLSKSSGTGVVGVGDNSGVFGFGAISGIVGSSTNSGVVGTGAQVGVRGVNNGTEVGVFGSSTSGIGVLGEAVNESDDLIGIGVKGVGLRRGGVFQVSLSRDDKGSDTMPEFANVQLTPVPVKHFTSPIPPSPYKSNKTFPDLPKNGKAGDLLAVQIPNDSRGAQLWFCIKSDDQGQNATWSRVQLENELTVP